MRSFKKILAAAIAAAMVLAPAGKPEAYGQEGLSGLEYPVMNVLLPLSLDFTIDPFEINGRGQVHSEEYVIRNLGDTGVTVRFDRMDVAFAGEGDFEALAEPFDENSGSGRKSIYLSMNFEGGRFPPVVMTDAQAPKYFAALLEAPVGGDASGSALSFSFSGSVNHLPYSQWQEGDVKVEITYSLEAAFSENSSGGGGWPDDAPDIPAEPSEPTAAPETTEEPLEPVELPGQTEEPLEPVEPPGQTEGPLESVEPPGQTEEPLEPVEPPGQTEEPLEPVEPPEQTDEPPAPGDSQPTDEHPPAEPAQGEESDAAEGTGEKFPDVTKAP